MNNTPHKSNTGEALFVRFLRQVQRQPVVCASADLAIGTFLLQTIKYLKQLHNYFLFLQNKILITA